MDNNVEIKSSSGAQAIGDAEHHSSMNSRDPQTINKAHNDSLLEETLHGKQEGEISDAEAEVDRAESRMKFDTAN